jgi:hypothetical protein
LASTSLLCWKEKSLGDRKGSVFNNLAARARQLILTAYYLLCLRRKKEYETGLEER